MLKKHISKFRRIVSLMLVFMMSITTSVGFSKGILAAEPINRFVPEATSAEDSLNRANEFNKTIMEEGIVLLKNKDQALPIQAGSKVSVLGKSSVNPLLGGAGSSAGETGGKASVDVFISLVNAGYEYNPVLREFYENNELSGDGRPASVNTGALVEKTGETPLDFYPENVTNSLEDYNDFAIVYITRVGGEGFDLSTKVDHVEGRNEQGQHYLELDSNEEDLIEYATTHFDKVVVVLNISTSFEVTKLEANDKIDAILWIGLPGATGLDALGKVLNGQVNPSGRTVDIYASDFKKDPTFQNFAKNAEVGNQYKNSAGVNAQRYFVEYEEGIYLGYRYYETRGFIEGEEWYQENVTYPFGYGLSYTSFKWEVKFPDVTLTPSTVVDVKVKVKNTGNYAGKDVVQLYASAPYYDSEIEKAHVVLVGFAKTKTLKPGESQTLTISVPVELLASYDYNDANFNDFKGYEVERGNYTLYVGKNSHDAWVNGESKTYNVAVDMKFEKDSVTGVTVDNKFDDVSAYFGEKDPNIPFSGRSKLMSRTDFAGTFPTAPIAEELILSAEELDALVVYPSHNRVDSSYDDGQPWYTDVMPQYAEVRETAIKLTDLVGLDYEDELWDEFISQLTIQDYANIVVHGFFGTYVIEELNVPRLIMPDGPTGFVGNMSGFGEARAFYASPIVVSSTWNVELAERQGEIMGDEALWMGYGGIYAPATNTHRTPFSGRNFEYYSEDPHLAGKFTAAVTRGLQGKGISVFIKHFAVNDQETDRASAGLVTWADEQTMREIYFKSFEIGVKEGKATGMMSAFNRIGTTWAGASYALLTEVLRGEWGFQGAVITDWGNGGWMNQGQMLRAGNDFYLGMKFGDWFVFGSPTTAAADLTPTYVTLLQKASKNVLYVVANSAAMQTLDPQYSSEFTPEELNLGQFDKGAVIEFAATTELFEDITYELINAPKGIVIDEETGIISGTIAADALAGKYDMVVTLKSRSNKYISRSITLELEVNGGLSFIGQNNVTITRGDVVEIDVRSTVLGLDGITYEIVSGALPAGLVLSNGRLVGSVFQQGTINFSVKATLDGYEEVITPITINVVNPKIILELEEKYTAKEGEAVTINVAEAAVSNAKYSATGLPSGLTISENGVISGTPTANGTFAVEVKVESEGYESATTTISFEIAKKDAPVDPEDPVDPVEPTEPEEKSNTVLFVVLGSVAVLGIAGGAFVFIKKRK